MVKAATRRVVDFSQAKPFDPLWRLRLRWLVDAMQLDDESRLAEVLHSHYSDTMTVPQLSPDSFAQNRQLRWDQVLRLKSLAYPWLHTEPTGPAAREVEQRQARDQWINRFGDPNDPAVQENITKVAAALQKRYEESAPPPPRPTKNKRAGRSAKKRRRH